MAVVDLGDPLPLQVTIYNAAGVAENATSVVLTLTLPDGTTATPTVTAQGSGVYTAAYTPTTRGRFIAAWVASGTNACAVVDVHTVQDPAAAIVGLAEAQSYLGETRDSQQDAVRDVLDAASDVVKNYTGRVWRRQSVVETYDGGRATIPLRSTPVLSVTSVTENGTATTNYTLDQASGLLHKGTTTSGGTWLWGRQNVVVTYLVGASSIPGPVRRAVLSVARKMWDAPQGGARANADKYAAPVDLIPREDRLALDPYRAPGF